MRGGLVGDEIEVLAAACELWNDVRSVTQQPDRQRPPVCGGAADAGQRIVERIGRLVQIAGLEPALDPCRVDLHAQNRGADHRARKRLCSPHPPEPRSQDRATRQVRRPEVLLAGGRERLVRALQDPLRPDVDPAPRGHLAVHRQAERLQAAELFPRRPPRHQQCVGDQHPRCARMRAEDADRLAALDEERLVLAELEQAADEGTKRLRVARGLPGAPVDDQILGPFCDLGIEVVEQHP